jgi:integrase
VRRPKDNVRDRRLTEAEYRVLGVILRKAAENEKYEMSVAIIRQLALTGCRRTEIVKLQWVEADTQSSCLRLECRSGRWVCRSWSISKAGGMRRSEPMSSTPPTRGRFGPCARPF